ncbi:MAG: CidA/LrgA family protein [Betaproteobacteria bacterium]|nr:CidA/LrgA family protein [Betaproteobacteria bacterium]MCL2885303.1 CidA/LrgA family protein [Betaproteobacteria bacterium]
MVESLFFLLLLQLLGEAAVHILALPIPSAVLGMLLLWFWLLTGLPVPKKLETLVRGILNYLTLLFIPAAVGIIEHKQRIVSDGWWLLLVLVFSTLLGIAAAAWVMRWLEKHDAHAAPSGTEGAQ